MRRGLIVQFTASSLKPAWSCISRAVLSQRNTPANFPWIGTTALLNTLLAVGNGLRGMMGLRVSRQTTSAHRCGLSCHGMLGSAASLPAIMARDEGPSTRTDEADAISAVVFTSNVRSSLPVSRHERLKRLIASQRVRVPVQKEIVGQARRGLSG